VRDPSTTTRLSRSASTGKKFRILRSLDSVFCNSGIPRWWMLVFMCPVAGRVAPNLCPCPLAGAPHQAPSSTPAATAVTCTYVPIAGHRRTGSPVRARRRVRPQSPFARQGQAKRSCMTRDWWFASGRQSYFSVKRPAGARRHRSNGASAHANEIASVRLPGGRGGRGRWISRTDWQRSPPSTRRTGMRLFPRRWRGADVAATRETWRTVQPRERRYRPPARTLTGRTPGTRCARRGAGSIATRSAHVVRRGFMRPLPGPCDPGSRSYKRISGQLLFAHRAVVRLGQRRPVHGDVAFLAGGTSPLGAAVCAAYTERSRGMTPRLRNVLETAHTVRLVRRYAGTAMVLALIWRRLLDSGLMPSFRNTLCN
jgi:hypothetical protein